MATVLHKTQWSMTSGSTSTVTIPAATAGSTLIVTSGGAAITSAQIINSSGTAFTKRTTYGGGDYDVSIQDFVASGGETAVYLSLNGPANVGGHIYEIAGLGAYVSGSASSNGSGVTGTTDNDFHCSPASSALGSGSAVLVSTFVAEAETITGRQWRQLGPYGGLDVYAVQGFNDQFVGASGLSDITAAKSYPANLAAGSYKATSMYSYGRRGFACQAMYADSSGVLTVPAPTNPIVGENTLPGTYVGNWHVGINAGTDSTIAGFTDKTSYSAGDTVNFKVDSANTFRVEIYRLGFYGLDLFGARNVVGNQAYITGTPTTQITPSVDGTTGATSCAWDTDATWAIPSDACSGVYWVLFRRTDAGNTGHYATCHFIVKSSITNRVAAVLPDFTYQAYNAWGATTDHGDRASGTYTGRSLYELGVDGNSAHRAYAVSFDRPYATQNMHNNTYLFDAEQTFICFAEAQGYDLTYLSSHDLDANTTLLNDAKLAVFTGHHEYWTANLYDCITNATDAGINLLFQSSNTALWHVRFAAGDTNRRTMICYKDSLTVDNTAGFTGTGIDPTSYTGTWRDSRTSTPNNTDIRRENALTGQLFTVNGPADRKYVIPFASKGSPIWRNSASVQALTTGQTWTSVYFGIGDEVDSPDGSSGQPPNFVQLGPQTVTDFGSLGANAAGSTYTTALPSVIVSLTLYRRNSGALVFNTGSWRGSLGLDRFSRAAWNSADTPDLDWQNAWLAILYDLGVAPTTLTRVSPDDTQVTNPSIGAPGPGRDVIAAAYGLSVPSSVSAAGSGSFTTTADGASLASTLAAGAGKALLSAAAVAALAVGATGSASLSGTAGGTAHVISAAAGDAQLTATAAGVANVGQGNVGSASALFSAGGQASSVATASGSGLAQFNGAGSATSIQLTTGSASFITRATGTATTGSILPPRDVTITIALIADRWKLTMGDDVPREIHTSLGGKEYVGLTITETTGKDISTDAVQLTLGSWTTPGTWRSPDSDNGLSPRVVKLLIGDTYSPAVGEYYLWVKLPDSSEVVVRRFEEDTITVD